MKAFAAPVLAALAAGEVAMVRLIAMQFPSGTIALNTSNWDFVHAGTTYRGAYGLGTISVINDTPGEVQGLQFELHGIDTGKVSLALDEADEVQGTLVTLRTAIIDLANYQILDAPIDWRGRADTMPIVEDGETAAIRCTVESKAVDLLRGNPLTYSDGDQQALHPGDRAFEMVVGQTDKPVVWPAKEFFYK